MPKIFRSPPRAIFTLFFFAPAAQSVPLPFLFSFFPFGAYSEHVTLSAPPPPPKRSVFIARLAFSIHTEKKGPAFLCFFSLSPFCIRLKDAGQMLTRLRPTSIPRSLTFSIDGVEERDSFPFSFSVEGGGGSRALYTFVLRMMAKTRSSR